MPGSLSRRTLLAAGMALPVAGGLGACAPSDRRSGPVQITFWSALRGSEEVVEAFNRSQDRIEVIFEQVPSGVEGGYAKLSNAARAGNAPDIATIEYPQVPGFAIDGVARDITDLISDRLRARLLPQSLELTTFGNRAYAVPLDIEPMVLHYRTDLFARYGLDVPRTWEEFTEQSRIVRDKAPDSYLTLFPTDGGTQFAAYAWQAGAQWFETRGGAWNVSLTDEPTRRVADYWQRLIDEGLAFVGPSSSRQNDALLEQGRLLTRLTGAWDAGAQMQSRPGQRGQWAIAPLPQWDPDRPVLGTHGGSTFAITPDSEHPEAAMEFIEWQVSSPDALRARLSAGTSAQYPAVPDLVGIGSANFDHDYYSGQNIYELFEQEAKKVRHGWVWGPRMTATLSVMHDGFALADAGTNTVFDAIRNAQDGTAADLRTLGLATTERHN